MKNKTLETIRKHNLIEKGMHIVIGLSGGPDSVCLFDVLQSLSAEMDLKLYAVHVNHKLRPVAAEEDQAYVEALCEANEVPCHIVAEDCQKFAKQAGMTSEEAGREIRYKAFAEMASRVEASGVSKEKIAIALAHNANDQSETILFRIMRGTGTDGLAGIPYKRFDENGYAIIRPILDIKREEIENYCEERKLSPRIDHTNDENLYARNKIRNLLIPFMEENFNENIIETVNRLGKIAAEDRDYMEKQALSAYKDCREEEHCSASKVAMKCKSLLELHSSIRFRVYTLALAEIGMTQNISFAQSELIDKVLASKSPSAIGDITEKIKVSRQYDLLTFMEDVEDENGKWEIKRLTPQEFEEYKVKAAEQNKVYGAFAGVEQKELCLRTRKPGDKINTGNGTKKIQDFFVDQKVPKVYRDDIMLLAKGSDVLWVLPSKHFTSENMAKKGRFSARYRVSKEKEEPVIVLEKL
ncbi:MAG: tRNA lysidine(34) synthetase TilS [Firmicutes bacterium]|nr:tRNA lysidine(34) synthetase TilS [Bacillota bacterium]